MTSGGSTGRRRIVRRACSAAFALLAAGAVGASAQEPPDTLPPDTLQVDSTLAVSDTLQATQGQEVPDSLRVDTLISVPWGRPAGYAPGVWVFSREDILSSRALSLADLLAKVPGMIHLRGGDYGTPRTVTAFGLGGGRIRIYWDGFEMLPLDGAVVDLARVGLAGFESVRVERGPAEIRVDLESIKVADPRPMSLVEAGTGDFDTNLFRGTFVHPRALGGNVGVAIERLDTRGRAGAERGSQTGYWARYTLTLSESAGLRAEVRQGSAESDVDLFPPDVARRDWTVRARLRLAEGVVAEAFTGGSSVEGGEDDGLTPIDESRSQHGLRLGLERGPAWASGSFRVLGGLDLPGNALELAGGVELPSAGGVSASWSREGWEDESTGLTTLRAWSRPLFGLSAFGSWQSGTRGGRVFPVREPLPDEDAGEEPEEPTEPEEPEEPLPTHRITDRTAIRLGAAWRWGPVDVSGAWIRMEADSLVPLGLLTDRGGVVVAGGERTGFEVAGHLGLPVGGFGLYGSLQQWDEEARYLPRRVYTGGVDFHDVFLDSGNLEVWGSIGVEGRDPMLVPLADPDFEPPTDPDAPAPDIPLQRVPFFQSWHAFVQVRIVTVRVFVQWDNFTVRRGLQDYPDRLQPITRATYGVRWTLWN